MTLGGATAGTLAEASPGEIYFEYSAAFIEGGFPLSPYFLPLKEGLHRERTLVFDGLFGVFDDSLPDGWGRLLMDREFRSRGVDPATLSPLDRLAYIGARGLGALGYKPSLSAAKVSRSPLDLAQVAAQAERIVAGSAEHALPALIAAGGSPGGARPKILVFWEPKTEQILAGANQMPRGYQAWMVKFRAEQDPIQAGRLEYAYLLMAQAAGIQVPEYRLFSTKAGDYCATRRFDIAPNGQRVHIHTLGGLIHANQRVPNRDYQEFLEITLDLTKDHTALIQAYRRMAFNVMAHNRDDHVKNFAYQYEAEKGWRLTPAYDLTFSNGIRGQHNMTVLGRGTPKIQDLRKIADTVGIERRSTEACLQEVRSAVSGWPSHARAAGVPRELTRTVAAALEPSE